MKPCVSNAMLDGVGLPASCEGDLLSAISMLALQALGSRSVAVMDLPAFDVEDDTLLLWHCGSAPFDMADRGVRCCPHYRAAFDEGTGADPDGPVTDMTFRTGPVTVFRLTGDGDRFFLFSGEIFEDGKRSWDGSRGWVRDLKLYGEPIGSRDLMNTVLTGGLPHHFPVTLCGLSEEAEEMAAWLGLRRAPRLPYADGLRAC
jgi:L-fucose isomerase-like protein